MTADRPAVRLRLMPAGMGEPARMVVDPEGEYTFYRDRPSAATPEEVLDGWRRQHRSGAADRQSEQWWLADQDFLDLIRRAQAAQAPRVLKPTDPIRKSGQ